MRRTYRRSLLIGLRAGAIGPIPMKCNRPERWLREPEESAGSAVTQTDATEDTQPLANLGVVSN